MAGSGKSEAARVFEDHGFTRVRFGDLTDGEIARRGLELNETNERRVREELRREHGMDAYARLSLPRIEAALAGADVIIDGLYSWEEYVFLKEHFGESLAVVAVWASPLTRYARLTARSDRGLTVAEAAGRDRAEIEKLNKGGPIAMADFTMVNQGSLAALRQAVERVIRKL